MATKRTIICSRQGGYGSAGVVHIGNGENVVRHEIRHCFVVSTIDLLHSFVLSRVVLENDAVGSCNFFKISKPQPYISKAENKKQLYQDQFRGWVLLLILHAFGSS